MIDGLFIGTQDTKILVKKDQMLEYNIVRLSDSLIKVANGEV